MKFDMFFQRATLIFLGTVLSVAGFIGQSSAAAAANPPAARIHSLGLKNISADTNAANFMRIWVQPETTALATQTLDKLSRWAAGGSNTASSALIRPLLEDLVYSEFYLDARFPTNSELRTLHSELGTPNSQLLTSSSQFVLAVRLHPDRARLWQTNLPIALKQLTGISPVTNSQGWTLNQTNPPHRIEYTQIGDWTFLAVNFDGAISKSKFVHQLPRSPQSANTNNFWLETDLDLPRAADISFPLLSLITRHTSLSHIHLTLGGEASNVITRATIDLSMPLPATLPAWEIPTNLIHEPVSSFTAVRGISSWLTDCSAWQKLQLSPAPDQAYFWAQPTAPFQSYIAAPLPSASNQLYQLVNLLVHDANPWLATNAEGFFRWENNPPNLLLDGVPVITPFLKPVVANQKDFVFGCLASFAEGDTNPPASDILQILSGTPALVYYQVEQTDVGVDADLFVSQLLRLVFNKPQLPQKGATILWLKKSESFLGASSTTIIKTGPQQLSLKRKSTLGLTALELHLLADWLESPQFPNGLYTFLAPPDKK
jgi:hypothetical protein